MKYFDFASQFKLNKIPAAPVNARFNAMASTYLDLANYTTSDGKLTSSLYDGHSWPKAEGTVEQVIAHLESLLYLDTPEIEPLKWQGPNGWYYDGAEAGKVIRQEIADLRDGSHYSLAD